MATIYKYNDYEYRDDAEEFTADEVKKQLTQYFPELANATTSESKNDDGDKVVTFVKNSGTKGSLSMLCGIARDAEAVERPMSDVDLFRLEYQVRCVRNGGRTIELDPDTVLSLINEARYLRSLLGKPAEELSARLASTPQGHGRA